jgi:hypothetical protein
MTLHDNYVSNSAPLSAEGIQYCLVKPLMWLEKIEFKAHDLERLFKVSIKYIGQLRLLDEKHNEHVMECCYEILTIEKLLNYLYPEQPLSWLSEYNDRMKCSPIDIMPCCGLAAFTVVRIVLEDELKGKSGFKEGGGQSPGYVRKLSCE